MLKMLSVFLGSLAAFLGLALLIVFNVFLYPVLGFWLVGVDLIFLFAGLAFISCLGDFSIPFVRTLLARAYYRAKFKKRSKKGRKESPYLKSLVALITLFKSAEEGFDLIKEEAHLFYEQTFSLQKGRKKAGGKVKQKDLAFIHRQKRQRAGAFSALTLVLLLLGGLATGFLSYLLSPGALESQAADEVGINEWIQTNWEGWATSNIASHPEDKEGWTELSTTTDNIAVDGDGNITMASGTQELVDTEREDFDKGKNLLELSSHNQDGRKYGIPSRDNMPIINSMTEGKIIMTPYTTLGNNCDLSEDVGGDKLAPMLIYGNISNFRSRGKNPCPYIPDHYEEFSDWEFRGVDDSFYNCIVSEIDGEDVTPIEKYNFISFDTWYKYGEKNVIKFSTDSYDIKENNNTDDQLSYRPVLCIGHE